eukprot:356323-Chlamydomonas_euryale.AAC.4
MFAWSYASSGQRYKHACGVAGLHTTRTPASRQVVALHTKSLLGAERTPNSRRVSRGLPTGERRMTGQQRRRCQGGYQSSSYVSMPMLLLVFLHSGGMRAESLGTHHNKVSGHLLCRTNSLLWHCTAMRSSTGYLISAASKSS